MSFEFIEVFLYTPDIMITYGKMMTALITNIIIQCGLEGVFQEIITCITDMVINFIEEINIWIYVK